MRVLITNDDGPPNASISPYIANFVQMLQRETDWEIVVAVPSQQRSWIAKAHIIGENVEVRTAKFEETGDLEWLLLNGTPASCANICVAWHGPFDLVISGPNYGRNTTAAYIMSSGTVGAATEAAVCGVKSIALSYSYEKLVHPEAHVTEGSRVAVALVQYLWDNWAERAEVYSINIPLFAGLGASTPIRYTPILENKWDAAFVPSKDTKNLYIWSPDYDKCDETAVAAGPGSDGWVIMQNEVTVSPFRAVFAGVDAGADTIDLSKYRK